MEQEPIDVTRATLAPKAAAAGLPRRRSGTPLWVQILLSLVVIGLAIAAFAFFFPGAHDTLARMGINLPGDAAVETAAAPAASQRQTAAGQGTQAAVQAGTQTSGQGSRQPAGQGGGQAGFGARSGGVARSTAVVVAETVTSGVINDKLSAMGEGSAIRSVTVTSASGGTLLNVAVKPGDKVAAGAPLAALDADTQQIAYDRAKLSAEDADAALDRANELAKSNSLSNVQLATAQLAADTAKLELRNAQLALSQRTISTPIAGTVGLIQISPGNQINAQTIVTTIDDASQILVNFWVPERYASQIANGMTVIAESVALPGQSFTGTVTAVDNRVDPESRTLQVQATLPNDDGTIRPGMSFAVAMSFPGQTFPAVDPLSIQWSNAGAYVWKIVDGKVVKGMVEIVQRNSDGVLVQGDVALGDQVVTQGVLQLFEGSPVRLLDDPATPANGAAAAPAGQQPAAGQGNGQRRTGGQGGAQTSTQGG